MNVHFTQGQFRLSDSVDGSPIEYNITNTDTSGQTCGSPKIIKSNSSHCVGTICTVHFSPPNICSSKTQEISVHGSNVLGDGNSSTEIIG